MSVEYLIARKHTLKILCKSKHFPRRYRRKRMGVFFWTQCMDELEQVDCRDATIQETGRQNGWIAPITFYNGDQQKMHILTYTCKIQWRKREKHRDLLTIYTIYKNGSRLLQQLFSEWLTTHSRNNINTALETSPNKSYKSSQVYVNKTFHT